MSDLSPHPLPEPSDEEWWDAQLQASLAKLAQSPKLIEALNIGCRKQEEREKAGDDRTNVRSV